MKLFIIIFILAVISGCVGEEKAKPTPSSTPAPTAIEEKANTKEVTTMQNISISAEAFQAGGAIPEEYTCDGRDISPELSWKGIPADAKSIALIMDDPDAPGRTFVHWVIYNIPKNSQKLPKGIPKNKTLSDGSRQGINDFGGIGYGGPCPPKEHRYYFKIYALDAMLDLPAGASKADVEIVMKGHILATGELMGKYRR